MPTGYTADVATGKVTSLRDYALTCARGMGALIMMRDMPMDAPIPERFEPSDFYAKELEAAKRQLAEIEAMSESLAQIAADAELSERKANAERSAADKREQRARYDEMLSKVSAWEGSPDGLKSFMMDQLSQSREFDCGGDTWYQSLDPVSGPEWRAAKESELRKKIERYEAEHQSEVERTEGRNTWVAQLRAALETV